MLSNNEVKSPEDLIPGLLTSAVETSQETGKQPFKCKLMYLSSKCVLLKLASFYSAVKLQHVSV